MESTMVMEAPPVQEASVTTEPTAEEVPSALDFDFDLGTPEASQAPTTVATETATNDVDFDLGGGGEQNPAAQELAQSGAVGVDAEAGNSIDFDIAAPSSSAVSSSVDVVKTTEASAEPVLDFDFDLGGGGGSTPPLAEQATPPLDLSSISLDLGEPAPPVATGGSSEAATKLELAQAYEEMGDHEGARELLQEVLVEGSPAQQETARNKLAQIGS